MLFEDKGQKQTYNEGNACFVANKKYVNLTEYFFDFKNVCVCVFVYKLPRKRSPSGFGRYSSFAALGSCSLTPMTRTSVKFTNEKIDFRVLMGPGGNAPHFLVHHAQMKLKRFDFFMPLSTEELVY